MIDDNDIKNLYRCLLGRDPEDADTIAAFRSYYPSFERGRKAVLESAEFQTCLAQITGHSAARADHEAASLGLAFLMRATTALAPQPAEPRPENATIRAAMAPILKHLGRASLAVAIGDSPALRLEDLAPFGRPEAAILHLAAGFPPVVPLASTLEDGTTLFRLSSDPTALANFLATHSRHIDALYLLGRPAAADWMSALQPRLAANAVIVLGPPQANFDPAALSAAIAAQTPAEQIQHLGGLLIHHLGGWQLPVTYAPQANPPPLPNPAGRPKLAIAAIVRNEANCVENMLRSTHGAASFYAVLDTGSDDQTPALVQAYLANAAIPHAFAQRNPADFNDNFAAMRNAALDMVPDWIDWILMLDADEELEPEDLAPLLDLIATAPEDAIALPRYNYTGPDKRGQVAPYPDRQIRLLRNTADRRIRYSGRVHETIRDVIPARPTLDESAAGGPRGGPHIHHLVRRFRTPEEEDRKQEFYRQIAERNKDKG